MGRPRISLSPHQFGVRSTPNPVLNTQQSQCFFILVVNLKIKHSPSYTKHPILSQCPSMDDQQHLARLESHDSDSESCFSTNNAFGQLHSPHTPFIRFSHQRPRRHAFSSYALFTSLLMWFGGVSASRSMQRWACPTCHPSGFVVSSSPSPSCLWRSGLSHHPQQNHARTSGSLSIFSRRSRRGDVRCSVDAGLALYDLQIWAKELVDTQLTHLTPVSGAVLYGAGLLTSLSPCALSLVPLTMAYLTDDGTDPSRDQKTLLFRAGMFTVGLATSLSVLGISATLAGKLFGSAGAGALGAALPLTASAVAIVMGLNLLDLVNLKLPSFDATLQLDKFPPSLQAFLLGATSALIASPCSTPVLASILGFVAASGEPYLGAGLLFSYSLGYSTPLLLAGILSGTVTSFIAKRGDGFSWVTPATAAMLISYGTYSSLSTLFPPLG